MTENEKEQGDCRITYYNTVSTKTVEWAQATPGVRQQCGQLSVNL